MNSFSFNDYMRLTNQMIKVANREGYDLVESDQVVSNLFKFKNYDIINDVTEYNSQTLQQMPRYDIPREITMQWFKQGETEIEQGYDGMFVGYVLSELTSKQEKLFENVREIALVAESANSALRTEFEEFCKYYCIHVQGLFEEFITSKTTINLNNEINLFALFDWIVLYSASYRSFELFNVIYENTCFPELFQTNFEQFVELFNRTANTGRNHSIIDVITRNITAVNVIINKFGRLNVWKILLNKSELVSNTKCSYFNIFSSYCEILFNSNLMPKENDEDYEQILGLILDFRDADGKNIMHLILLSLFSGRNMTSTNVANFNQNVKIFDHLIQLTYEVDNNGVYPHMFVHPNNIDFLLNTRLVNISNLVMFSSNKMCTLRNPQFAPLLKSNIKYLVKNKLEDLINMAICVFDEKSYEIIKMVAKEFYDAQLGTPEITNILIKKINYRIFNQEYPIFAILGCCGIINSLLEFANKSPLNIQCVPVVKAVEDILQQYPFLFNFAIESQKGYYRMTNIDNQSCENIIGFLAEDQSNHVYILNFLNSIKGTTNEFSHTTMNKILELVLIPTILLAGSNNDIFLEHDGIIILWMTKLFTIFDKMDRDMFYVKPFFNDKTFGKVIESIMFLLKNDKSINVSMLVSLLDKCYEYNKKVTSELIVNSPDWVLWNCVKEDFSNITTKIITDNNYKITDQIIDDEMLLTTLHTLTKYYPDIFSCLLACGYFDDFCTKKSNLVSDACVNYNTSVVFSLMLLKDFDFECIPDLLDRAFYFHIHDGENTKAAKFLELFFTNFKYENGIYTWTHNRIQVDNIVQTFLKNFVTNAHNRFITIPVKNQSSDSIMSEVSNQCRDITRLIFKKNLITPQLCGPEKYQLVLTTIIEKDETLFYNLNLDYEQFLTNLNDFYDLDNIVTNQQFENSAIFKILCCCHFSRYNLKIAELKTFLKTFNDIIFSEKNLANEIRADMLCGLIELEIPNIDNIKKILEIRTIVCPTYKLILKHCLISDILGTSSFESRCSLLYKPIFSDVDCFDELICHFVNITDIDSSGTELSDIKIHERQYSYNLMKDLCELAKEYTYMSINLINLIMRFGDPLLITDTMITFMLDNDNCKTIHWTAYDYVNLCCSLKLEPLKAECLYKTFPNTLLCMENLEKKLKLVDINTITQLFRFRPSDKQECEILNYVKNNLTQPDLILALEHITIFSQFMFENMNLILTVVKTNPSVLQRLVNAKNCPPDMLLTEDSNGDFQLMAIPVSKISADTAKIFIDLLTTSNLTSVNKRGNFKILHFLHDPYIGHILQRKDVQLLFSNKKIGPIVFKSLMESVINKSLAEIVEVFPENIRTRSEYIDPVGNNFYMLLLSLLQECDTLCEVSDVINMLKSEANLKDILLHKNYNGNNLLFLSAHYDNLCAEFIKMYIEIVGLESLMDANNSNETFLMYVIRHNPNLLYGLLNNPDIRRDQNYVYVNTGSILTHAIEYCEDVDTFDSLFKWINISQNPLDNTQQVSIFDWTTRKHLKINMSVEFMACVFNKDIFKLLLDLSTSNITKNTLLIGETSYDIFEIAYLYEPESFQYLCGSKYLYANFPNERHKNFMYANSKVQPGSWFKFVSSANYNNNLYTPDQQYVLDWSIRPQNIKSSAIARYIQTKNEPSTNKDDKCEVCYVYKKKIMYNCYKHLTCVVCCYKSENCPFCRNTGQERLKIFD